MNKYYYLIASLPDLTLEDHKLSYTTLNFKEECYGLLSDSDKKIIDLFYLKFDNANLLKLLKDSKAQTDIRGNFTPEELLQVIAQIKEGGQISGKHIPLYFKRFISSYFEAEIAIDDHQLENRLAALYHDHGMRSKNRFIASWFTYNLDLNNIMLALVSRKYKFDIAPNVVQGTATSEAIATSGARDFGLTSEVEFFEQLVKISETENILEREQKIDQMKWEWIEDETFFNYFSIERIFSFLLKIEMVERWINLDKKKGKERFKEMVEALKNEVSIPEEFK